MNNFVLHNEYNIEDIKSYKDHFGDYLTVQDINDGFFQYLDSYPILKRDIMQSSMHKLLTDKNIKEDFIIVNAASSDYLVFKDKFLINNNPHLILDGSLLIAEILNIKRIDIISKINNIKIKRCLSKNLIIFFTNSSKFSITIFKHK